MSYVRRPIQKLTVDAKGDLILGTANDAVARHAAGSNGFVPVYDSTQSDGMQNRAIAAVSGAVILQANGYVTGGMTAGTRAITSGDVVTGVGTDMKNVPLIFWTGQFAAVSNWVEEVLIVATLFTNGTAPAADFQFTLRPITANAGGAGVVTGTVGTALTGSSFSIAAPPAGSRQTGNSGWITAPTANADAWGLFVANSATTAANSTVLVAASVFHRFVN